MKDTLEKFSSLTIGLHWLIAIGVIVMLAFGLYLEDLPRSPEKGQLMGIHKSIGILILVIASLRIFWRIYNKFPTPLSVLAKWQAFLAKFTHWLLIIGTVLMPISGVMLTVGSGGAVAFFGIELIAPSEKNNALRELGGILHGFGGKLLILFIIMHIAATIKHQFIDKDNTLSRMLGRPVSPK